MILEISILDKERELSKEISGTLRTTELFLALNDIS